MMKRLHNSSIVMAALAMTMFYTSVHADSDVTAETLTATSSFPSEWASDANAQVKEEIDVLADERIPPHTEHLKTPTTMPPTYRVPSMPPTVPAAVWS